MILLTEENVINETKEYLEGGLYSNSLNGFISDFTELFLLLMIIGLSLRLIIGGIKAINEENGLSKFLKASRKKLIAVIIGICMESIILIVKGVYK